LKRIPFLRIRNALHALIQQAVSSPTRPGPNETGRPRPPRHGAHPAGRRAGCSRVSWQYMYFHRVPARRGCAILRTNRQPCGVDHSGTLDADAAAVSAARQEQPTMEAILSQQRVLPAIAAFAVGIAVSSLIYTPFGLLAPIVALFLFASDRTRFLLHVAS